MWLGQLSTIEVLMSDKTILLAYIYLAFLFLPFLVQESKTELFLLRHSFLFDSLSLIDRRQNHLEGAIANIVQIHN